MKKLLSCAVAFLLLTGCSSAPRLTSYEADYYLTGVWEDPEYWDMRLSFGGYRSDGKEYGIFKDSERPEYRTYEVRKDGTLAVRSNQKGVYTRNLPQVDTMEEALEKDGTFYVDKDVLIFDQNLYERVNR